MFTRFSLVTTIVLSGFLGSPAAVLAEFIPDPTPPPVITQSSGTR